MNSLSLYAKSMDNARIKGAVENMVNKRVTKGNNTVIPSGAEVIGEYATNAVTDRSGRDKGGRPISNERCVIEARIFNEEHKV